ncbi:MAG: hypothetical protein WBD34_10370, partial [Burkholderiaceae bacterium]
MLYCHYYWAYEPLKSHCVDNPSIQPAYESKLSHEENEYKVALLTDEDGLPAFGRIVIPNLIERRIPDDELPIIQLVLQHQLSSLRLTYNPTIQVFPPKIWAYFEEGEPYDINLKITMREGPPFFDPHRTQGIFEASINERETLRDFIDGVDVRVPPAYRFLSLYKVV